MLSYHNDAQIKEKYIARMMLHMEQDELIKGTGWNGQKGCAVGCILHKYEHKAFESELGIPIGLAFILDHLFETMSLENSKKYPLLFLKSIPIGVDLKDVQNKFLSHTLKRSLKSFNNKAFPAETKAVKDVIKLIETNCQNMEQWSLSEVAAKRTNAYTTSQSVGYVVRAVVRASIMGALFTKHSLKHSCYNINIRDILIYITMAVSTYTEITEVNLQADDLIRLLKKAR